MDESSQSHRDGFPILLGVADRALKRGLAIDLLGVTGHFAPIFYPLKLDSLAALLAIPTAIKKQTTTCQLELTCLAYPDRKGTVSFEFSDSNAVDDGQDERLMSVIREAPQFISSPGPAPTNLRLMSVPSATHVLTPVRLPPIMLPGPGPVRVTWIHGSEAVHLGDLQFGFMTPAPITEEERRALLANPSTNHAITVELGCPSCNEKLILYESLDGAPLEGHPRAASASKLSTFPDSWQCSCGKGSLDLTFMKASLPTLFRSQPTTSTDLLNLHPPYQHLRLNQLLEQFRQLLDTSEDEAPLQSFLETHHLFWSFLAPRRILHKPKVLTANVADFGILTANRTLVLVEIEKANTQLTKKSGGRHHQLQQPFDQISEWRQIVEQHRVAFLDMLDLDRNAVQEIRYLVVAGRNAEAAAQVRKSLSADTSFLTFDELSSHAALLQVQLAQL